MTAVPALPLGTTWPTRDTFEVLAAGRRVIPVVRRLMADGETAVSLYRKLAQGRPGTFLLESAEHDGMWGRYSIIGAASSATLTERDGQAVWLGRPPASVPTEGEPTEVLRGTLEALATDRICLLYTSDAADE